MATCPKCGSSNFRLQEPGAISNSYYCMEGKHSFDRPSPATKWGIIGTIASIAATMLLGVDLSQN